MSRMVDLFRIILPRSLTIRYNLFRYLALLLKISRFFMLIGLLYVLILPNVHLQKSTYISENALMPDYASSHYRDSFRINLTNYAGQLVHSTDYVNTLFGFLNSMARHENQVEIRSHANSKVLHLIIESERSDGTEALAIVAPLYNESKKKNICGVSTALAFANSFKDTNCWARDILVIFPEAGSVDLKDWLKHYISDRNGTAGTIQSAVCFEIEGNYCDTGFDFYSIHLEGPNGLLPNLDLVNSIVKLGEPRGINFAIGGHSVGFFSRLMMKTSYTAKLSNVISMLLRQAFNFPQNVHGPFLAERIDSVTIRAKESLRRENEEFHRTKFKSLFETVDGTFRSMNNVLEHLHQSFFFYILPDNKKYISIANFLPITAFLSAALLFKAIYLSQGTGASNINNETCFVVGLVLSNYLVWFFAKYTLSIQRYLFFPALILVPILTIQVTTRAKELLKFADKTLKSIVLVILAITIFSTSFLNFGLSVVMGFTSAIFVSCPKSTRLLQLTCLPSSMLLFAAINPASRSYAIEILANPSDWNFGIPFLLVQPLLILFLSCA